jgi:CO/xanthine dehydrogenase Mo-binding subunit
MRSSCPLPLTALKGDLATGEKLSAQILEARYTNAYVAHAPIETHAALASWEGGKVTVRASTQAPFMVRNQVAQACGVPAEKVRIITPYVGGGFGGKSGGPQAVEAARLSKLAGAPVLVQWDREAERFGWTPKSAPSGRGLGMACGVYRGTYVAAMTELAVDRGSGQVQVKRISFVQDMGVIVNPDGARQQVEGCLMMGLGYALTEEVPFKGTAILAKNFDTYEIPRFSWMPDLDIHLVPNPDVPAQGGGEPPIIIMGALLANAIFDATGVRLTHLPMTPARLKAALIKA